MRKLVWVKFRKTSFTYPPLATIATKKEEEEEEEGKPGD